MLTNLTYKSSSAFFVSFFFCNCNGTLLLTLQHTGFAGVCVMIGVRLVVSAHPWFNGMNYGFSSCRWEARYKIEVVIQTSLWPFTGWTRYSINRKGQHLDRGVSRGITTPDSSLLFEVADSMTKEGTLPNILCTRMSIAPYKCSIMLMTCLFLFLFFLCHFLFLCHIHLQLRLLLSSPLFLASFIFRHSADRCKWNER